ncbi:helix-turn-helix domain-containing protein, partial [Staphylococcus aureus]|nr:helix-turn-helix domain-containing protein [Staphylococcus aureus]
IQLSLTELQKLKLILKKEDKYVSRTAIIEKSWESENFIYDNTLAVNMTRLSKKLNTNVVNDFIITNKNLGYKV